MRVDHSSGYLHLQAQHKCEVMYVLFVRVAWRGSWMAGEAVLASHNALLPVLEIDPAHVVVKPFGDATRIMRAQLVVGCDAED